MPLIQAPASLGTVKKIRQALNINANVTWTITVAFPEPFANTNYTVVATAESATNELRVVNTNSVSTTQVIIAVQNIDTLNANTGTLHVIAIAD